MLNVKAGKGMQKFNPESQLVGATLGGNIKESLLYISSDVHARVFTIAPNASIII
jgi:hypothetical protein